MEKELKKGLLTTLIATVYTIPCAAAAGEWQLAADRRPAEDFKTRKAMVAQAISQEVIQLIQREESQDLTFNIAGRSGVYFRIYYSPNNQANTYRPLPGGEGKIGENGMASLPLKLKALRLNQVYLKVFTSDQADFSGEVRTSAEPLLAGLEEASEVQMEKSMLDDIKKRIRDKEIRTPSAVAAVRGLLPEPPVDETDKR